MERENKDFMEWNRIYICFKNELSPNGTAMLGQLVEGVTQASTSLPDDKNRDNLHAIRWIAF